jgi:hypothetical protein
VPIERNAPCPCGSGVKYKKCHGAVGVGAPLDVVGLYKAIAYKGAIGRRRESWCIDYITYKRAQIADAENNLKQESTSAGRTITCHQGCGTCCCAYVVASLQECEAIVYWLYHHDEALRGFLGAYKIWREKISGIQELFKKVYELQDRAVSKPTTDEERLELLVALSEFMKHNIQCPFLAEGACSIYEVRPFLCAGVVATTPSEWCLSDHPRHGEVELLKAEARFENDRPYFLQTKNAVSYGCMAFMVHTLLQGGYATLSTIPGLEGLKDEVYQDPEVRSVLLKTGYPALKPGG